MSNIFDELKEVDLDDLLSHMGVTTKGSGGDNVSIRTCPVCGNSNWKVRFSRDKKVGHCFYAPCETNFSLYSFIKSEISGSDRETIDYIRDYLGSTFVREDKARSGVIVEEWKMPESIPLPSSLSECAPCEDWLKRRRILPITQEQFGLRFCVEGKYEYTDASERAQKVFFNDRVILPVIDLDNRIRTFQGRAIWDVDEELGERRYLFPVGLPGSSHFLYGGHLVRGKEKLVLVEGPFDAMSVHQAFIGDSSYRDYGVCATFGLSLGHTDREGDDQLGVLKRLKREGLKEIIILWDSEKNAYNNALETALMLRSSGFKAKIANLPEGKDPNEVDTIFIKQAILSAKEVTKLSYTVLKLNNPYS